MVSHLARHRVGSLELRLQAFGRAELLQGLAVAAAGGVDPSGREVQQLPDPWSGVGLQGPFGAPQPSLALVKLARPGQVGGQCYQRGRNHRLRAPTVLVGERDRLTASLPGDC